MVILRVTLFGGVTSWLFKLDGAAPLAFPGVDLSRSLVLLEPGYLDSTTD